MHIKQLHGYTGNREVHGVILQDLHEIYIAKEAVRRAIIRTKGYSMSPRYASMGQAYDIPLPISRGWNYMLGFVHRNLRALTEIDSNVTDVLYARHIDPRDGPFNVKAIDAVAEHYRIGIHRNRQPHALLQAISAYDDPNKTGSNFICPYPVDILTLDMMISQSSEIVGSPAPPSSHLATQD